MHKFSLTTALSFILLWSSPGLALVIYDNGEPDLTGTLVEIDATNIRVADDFVVQPDAHILDFVVVWGSWDAPKSAGTTSEFLVQVLEDDNGMPNEDKGSVFEFLSDSQSGGREVEGGDNFYKLNIDSPDSFELVPGKTYWLVIQSIKSQLPGSLGWSWRSSSVAGAGNALVYDGSNWVSADGVDLAFNITMSETCDRMFSYYLFNYVDSEEATEVASCTRGQGGIIAERRGVDSNLNITDFYAAALDNSCQLGIAIEGFYGQWQQSLQREDYRAWKKFLANEGCETVQEATSEKTVFVTSQTFTGDLISEAKSLGIKGKIKSGLAAGDRICNALAEQAGLPGSYTAWLSDSSTDAIDRVTSHPLPYVLTDGTTAAAGGLAQIVSPEVSSGDTVLDHAICFDEFGTDHCSEDLNVWTGTAFTGLFSSACSDWTDGSAIQKGEVGRSIEAESGSDIIGRTTRWTQGAKRYCDLYHRLYCFQD